MDKGKTSTFWIWIQVGDGKMAVSFTTEITKFNFLTNTHLKPHILLNIYPT